MRQPQFDSVQTQIMASAGPNGSKNICDIRGQTLQNAGEQALKDCARMIYDNGGYATHAFMPTLLAADLQDVIKDRLRFGTDDTKGTGVIERYPTPFSDAIKIAGDDAGPDKMFFCRNAVSAIGLATTRPGAPTIAAVAAVDAASQFLAADAASYTYEVHAVSEDGISLASVVATVPVTAGESVALTITPNAALPGSGYIICRGKKGATTDLREIGRCAGGTAPVTFVDENAVLPGTGDVILISYDGITPSLQWDAFLPAMKFDLFPTLSAIIPFLIVMFGTPDCKVPWFHGIIRNVSPSGLGWF